MSPEMLRLLFLAIALACFVAIFVAQRFIARKLALELSGRQLGFAAALWETWRHPASARKDAIEGLRARSPRVRRALRAVMPLLALGIASAFLADLQLRR